MMLKVPRISRRLFWLSALGSAVLLYFITSTPPTNSDFPKAIADQLEQHGDIYFPDYDQQLKYFCFVGGYESVEGFLRERGMQSDFDLGVNEREVVLVLVGLDGEFSHHTFVPYELETEIDVYGCYPPIPNRLVFNPKTPYAERPDILTVERVVSP